MNDTKTTDSKFGRRDFLLSSGAAVLASQLSLRSAQGAPAPTVTRMNLADPMAASSLASYKKAIKAMIQLPPNNPHNWYRNAIIHILDCPHHNWWFLPWHRGYLSWFETLCRKYSNDPTFALPYWDWTAQPSIPASFADGSELDPSNPLYFDDYDSFKNQFAGPLNAYIAALTVEQKEQLAARGYNNANDVWNDLESAFVPRSISRQPDFGPHSSVQDEISINRIKGALYPQSFSDSTTGGFGSFPAMQHSGWIGEGPLETGPHDNVHGAIGGFMGAFLSPVDPIFFMHHANLDRLWDVWTRKQLRKMLPTLPTGPDLDTWSNEPFLFFFDEDGNPATKKQAGDYKNMSDFNYVYQPGSGEEVVPAAAPTMHLATRLFATQLSRSVVDFQAPTQGSADVPHSLVQTIGTNEGPRLYAKISLEAPANSLGARFFVVVNPPENLNHLGFSDPHVAGTISPFGQHGHAERAMTYIVSLTHAVEKLRTANLLNPNQPLKIQVIPDTRGITLRAFQAKLSAVTLLTQ